MIKINVLSRNKKWNKYINCPQSYFNSQAKRLSKAAFINKGNFQFTLLLSESNEVKYLNKTFRKKNKTTDVLSFPFYQVKELKKLLKKNESIYLGDIVINFNKIEKKNEIIFRKHLDQLWIHGLLHLFGYIHKRNVEYNKMRKLEQLLMNL